MTTDRNVVRVKRFPTFLNQVHDFLNLLPSACLSAPERVLLLALAGFANQNGGSCFPSMKRLVRITGLSRWTLNRAMRTLEAAGLLTVERSPGRVNRYSLSNIGSQDESPTPCIPPHPFVQDARGEALELCAEGTDPPCAVHQESVQDAHRTIQRTKHQSNNNQVASVSDRISWAEILNAWNEIDSKTKRKPIRVVTEARKRALRPLIEEFGMEAAITVFTAPERSAFLRGERGNNDWKRKCGADFDFFCKKEIFIKTLEGKYDDTPEPDPNEEPEFDEFGYSRKQRGLE